MTRSARSPARHPWRQQLAELRIRRRTAPGGDRQQPRRTPRIRRRHQGQSHPPKRIKDASGSTGAPAAIGPTTSLAGCPCGQRPALDTQLRLRPQRQSGRRNQPAPVRPQPGLPDALDRLVGQSDPSAARPNSPTTPRTTSPRSRTRAASPPATEYDGLSSLTRLVSPDSGTTTRSSTTPPATSSAAPTLAVRSPSIATTPLNRLIERHSPERPEPRRTVPLRPHRRRQQGIGRLGSIEGARDSLVYRYDERGNLVEQVRSIRLDQQTLLDRVTYRYDAANQLLEIGCPSGLAIGYPRNAGGQVASVTLAVGDKAPRHPGRADRLPALRWPAAAPDLGQRHHSQPRVRPGLPTAAAEGRPLAERLPARCQWQYPAAPPQPLGHPGLPVRPAGPPDRGTRRPGRAQLLPTTRSATAPNAATTPPQAAPPAARTTQYSPDSNRLTAIGAQAVTSDAAGNLTQDRAARKLAYDAQGRLQSVSLTASRSPNTATTPSASASSSSPPRASPPTSTVPTASCSAEAEARRQRPETAKPSTTCGWTACRWPPSTPTTTPRARSATRPYSTSMATTSTPRAWPTDASGQIAWQWQSDRLRPRRKR